LKRIKLLTTPKHKELEMNKEFKEFITYKVLEQKHSMTSLIDLDEDANQVGAIELKNVCAKLTKELSDRIDSTVGFLDIRKRKFIELALIQALDDAEEVIKNHLSDDEEWIDSQRTDKGKS